MMPQVLGKLATFAVAAVLPTFASAVVVSSSPQPMPAASSQVCAPAGYVTAGGTRLVGREADTRVTSGHFEYCLNRKLTDALPCQKWLVAEEYVKAKSGRQDAQYSGMAILERHGSLALFYCLPK